MKRMLLAVLVVLGLLATATVAHAATLAVAGRSIGTFSAQHPCPGTANAMPTNGTPPNYSQVTVTMPSSLCSGRTVQITVRNGATVVAQGSAVVSGATAVINVATFATASALTAVATVSGWNLPVTWSQPTSGPITIGNGNTTLVLGPWYRQGPSDCIQVTVGSNTTGTWIINLNMSTAPFTPAMTADNVTMNPSWPKPVTTNPVNGILQFTGGNGSNNVSGGTVTLCVR